jgi:hypothetical protein
VVGFAKEDDAYGGMSADEGDTVFRQAAIVIAEEDGMRFMAGGERMAKLRNRRAVLDC